MNISTEIKKKILNDWLMEFSQLSSFTQNKLFKIIGPLIAGIELMRTRTDKYRPTFFCYSLWESNGENCLIEPLFLMEMKNKHRLQLDIPYVGHESFLREAFECTREQIIISLENDVTIKSLFKLIDSQFSFILVKSSPVSQAKLYECKLFAALYVDDGALINKILSEINQASKSWAPNLFEWKFGKVDKWFQGLQEKMAYRQEFLNQIETNKNEKKLGKLKCSELIA